jgi:hypothetical protein
MLNSLKLLAGAILCLTGSIVSSSAQTPAGHLVNRYSFTADGSDAVGGAHGELLGGAYVSDGSAMLNGAGGYVNLPNNLCIGLTSLSFEAWVTESGSGGWARLLDFGNSAGGEDAQGGGTSYIFVAWPGGGGTSLRGCYRAPGAAEMYLDVSPRPAQGVVHHFVWTQDAGSAVAKLYLDGTLVGTYNGFTATPAQVGPTANNWLGRSQYNDPWWNGSIAEFRIYDFALPASEISRNAALGPEEMPLGPVQFLAQPQPPVVEEGRPFSLLADVTGAPPFQLQWQRNGTPIAGATGLRLDGVATLADKGAVFCLCATNRFTNASFFALSSNALLTVMADTNPPLLQAAQGLGTNGVEAGFSEPLRPDTATNLANYLLSGPGGSVPLSAASLSADGRTVSLTAAPLTAGASYTLTVGGVRDVASSSNLIPPGSQAGFIASPWPLRTIGEPAVGAALQQTNGGVFVLTAAGADIGGSSDECVMTSVLLTGDFDQQARLSAFVAPQAWAKAGLMARESLAANSPFAATLASPGPMGTFFETRSAVGAEAALTGQFPANYPQNWLRLKRVGDLFTGYASYDGIAWTPLGSATLSLSNTLQVGLAVASAESGAAASATFSAAGATLSQTTDVTTGPPETLGPSSRRTQLVISEIMHKPAARGDGRDLEFIEIYNANPWLHDLSGHRLGGDVEFTFPANTTIPGGGFFVIAAAPADLAAVYGLSGVFGPYTNRLKTSGLVRLYDEQGTLLLDVNYTSSHPWPVGADGTGHSIVLARPSYGEGDPRAWERSDIVGGSPGASEAFRPSPLRNVVLNEILAHTDPPDMDTIEMYNHANTDVDLSGCGLSDDPSVIKFSIPTNTVVPARGFTVFTEAELGFGLSAAGETLYFWNPDGSRVLDALQFEPQENGIAFGRSPDGAGQWYRLERRTLGASNAAPLLSEVVINELMYHPASGNDDDQYVELHNRSAAAVNLGGWKLAVGIGYLFPTNAVIAPGGHVVVAANAARLRTSHLQLNATNTFGDFSGRLSGSGERVALTKPDDLITTNASGFAVTNRIDIVVDELTYADGGRWGQWSDGGGSSLELVDPRADRRLAANWADSDESAKAPWTTIEATGTLDHGANYGANIGYAQLGLLDVGECLVDSVEVRPGTNGANYVANSEFTSGLGSWSLQGAFSRSSLNSTQGFGGGPALQLRTYNRIFTIGNSAQCALTNTSLANGQTATLRFKARWLRGSPDVLFRLNGNWLEAAGRLTLPANLGTPGLRNSRFVTNAPPAIHAVTHTPAVPAAGQPVVVTARVSDPDSVTNCLLLFRVDPSPGYVTYPMLDDGTGGDDVAGDGVYSARLPARPAGSVFPFVVQAVDRLGAGARFPELRDDNGPARECVVRWGDPEPTSAIGTYHLWLTQSNVTRWLALPILSNEEMDATFVYRGRVIYNASARYSGSPYHETVDGPAGNRACHYIWSMPPDDRFLGASAFNKIHWPGNDIQDDTIAANNNDSTLQREQTANTLLRGLGVPWISRRYVVVYVNGTRRGQVMEDALRPTGSVPDSYFPEDSGGSLYKIQPWFEGTALPDASGYIAWQNKGWAIVAPFRTTGGGYKTARYRWHYQPRDIPVSANDYTNVFTLLDAFNAYNDSNYPQIINGVVDVDQWLRVVAANHAAGNWDCYGIQNGQNVYGYVSPQRRWQLFMFDFNIVLGNRIAWSPGLNLETTQETAWERMYGATGQPVFRRLYWRALKELVNGPLQASAYTPLLDQKYVALRASGISPTTPQPIKDWLASARTSIASQVATRDSASFTMTPGPVGTTSNLVSLSGSAPLEVESFTVGGQSAVVRWTSTTAWLLVAPVPPGTNLLTVLGYDRHGNLVPGVSNAITVISTAVPESAQGKVVFNEIMVRPTQADAEYVELFNAATNTAFDLSGWEVNGLAYSFPTGTVLLPQRRLVLGRSQSTFANAYGVSNVVAGVFGGNLQEDGETLSLLAPGGLVVDRVRYETNAPWAAGALQPGTSLQLVDARQDNSRVGNWTVGRTNATVPPPQWAFFWTNLVASSSSRLYLYLQSAGELYVDDLAVVAGTVPEAGANLLANPGFESALSGSWSDVGNHSTSARNTAVKRTGSASLRILATAAGTGSANSIYQDISPALAAGATYTVSLWYLQSTNASSALTRFSSGAVQAVFNVAAPAIASSLVRTPGAANSVAANLPAFPTLWLNEVQPQNVTGPADNFGERDPWVEIYNAGSTTQSLAGLYLGTNYTSPMQWAFPSNATVAPGQCRLVWLDGQTAQSNATTLHASFRLSGGSGSLALSRYVSNLVQTVDYLNYSAVAANHSYGDVPDGQPFYRRSMFRASPGATNDPALPPVTVFINEWMAENTGFITDPGTGKYDDWFELYNPADTAADLGGYYLTDNLSNTTKHRIPAGYVVPAHGYLLVWADEATTANSTNSPALHVSFKLGKDGESIGLFAPDGTTIDALTFAAQSPNLSEGSIPDGGSLRLFLTTPTPGGPNVPPPADTPPAISGMTWIPGQSVTLSFTTAPGHIYRVEFTEDLHASTWTPLSADFLAPAASMMITDTTVGLPQRFYRVVMVE